MAVTPEDFEAAADIACQCLWKGNGLIHRAIEEPLEYDKSHGETIPEFRLASGIVAFCNILDAGKDRIPLIHTYLLRIADEPQLHDGLVAPTAHHLAWRFAHRIWLSVHNVLTEQTILLNPKDWYDGGPGFQLDRGRLDANWETVRDRLREIEPIDARLTGAAIVIESAKAAAAGSAGERAVTESPGAPKSYLFGWKQILDALDLKDTAEDRSRVGRLSKDLDGPVIIEKPGSSPKVDKDKLLAWWNHLEIHWQDQMHQASGVRLNAEAQHDYSREGTAAPEISGSVKPRRADRKP